MRFVFEYVGFALTILSSFSSAGTTEDRHPKISSFMLSAIIPRGTTPKINSKLQIVDDTVVVGSTDAEDFTAYILPNPKGRMKARESRQKFFFLEPVTGHPTPGYHNLKFHRELQASFKLDGFFATGAGCGIHCGGPQVVYDQTPKDDSYSGNWFAYPHEGNGGGYSIHWVAGNEAPEGTLWCTCCAMRFHRHKRLSD
ncbi:hypothetical protein PAAG_05155 [Paracoccidioides lutzii Pb01]|uniref:Uncharacterized protein n=1 Tax=Paracoccidioides lutzii (strain ATCC MYA-826 / Pb01) TaxID=502779 RepID=C1H312_PARBA|nr:hypothetical protein PAAG_05155 [Paracoccidioides lutzii Pb01]EEH34106.2 hypothetical protein PAAG_05155 [Paracoccidioides lutzii Pb01]